MDEANSVGLTKKGDGMGKVLVVGNGAAGSQFTAEFLKKAKKFKKVKNLLIKAKYLLRNTLMLNLQIYFSFSLYR